MTRAKADTADLTKEEQARVRTALKFLHVRFGGWQPLAKVLRQKNCTLASVARGGAVSARLAFRTARLVKVGIDDLLAGKFPDPNACPYCGHVAVPEENDGTT